MTERFVKWAAFHLIADGTAKTASRKHVASRFRDRTAERPAEIRGGDRGQRRNHVPLGPPRHLRSAASALFRPVDPHPTLSPREGGLAVGAHENVDALAPTIIHPVGDLPFALEAIDRDPHSRMEPLGLEVP